MQGQPIKCVVVGDGNVGKTSLLKSYTHCVYPGDEYSHEICDRYQSNVMANGRIYCLTLWDTAGEGDDRLRPMSYANTDVFLVCFSLVARNSFGNVLQKWLPEIKFHNPKTPFILVGTKEDARETNKDHTSKRRNQSAISTSEAMHLSNSVGAYRYVECSAKTSRGVKSVFDIAILAVISPKEKEEESCCEII